MECFLIISFNSAFILSVSTSIILNTISAFVEPLTADEEQGEEKTRKRKKTLEPKGNLALWLWLWCDVVWWGVVGWGVVGWH